VAGTGRRRRSRGRGGLSDARENFAPASCFEHAHFAGLLQTWEKRKLRFAVSRTMAGHRNCLDAIVAARKKETPSCEDCYFRKKMLCALDFEEPCATFRPNRPEGLVPPRQPVLLLRPPRWASESR
jgi:hypothetical protein